MAQTPITEGTAVTFVTTEPFTSISGIVVNPDTVTFKFNVQGGTVTTYTWINPSGDPSNHITNTSTGNFSIAIDTTGLAGTLFWQIAGFPSSGLDTTKTKVYLEGTLEISQASM